MHELLARAMAGVDPSAPGAIWGIYANLIALVPWTALIWWNVLFAAVGALLGCWRGGWRRGLAWGLVLGPIGWLVVVFKSPAVPATPPPLPRSGGKGPRRRSV
ncbi:MAG: hypothetical protein ABI379_11945 [Rhodanobacter sp.]